MARGTTNVPSTLMLLAPMAVVALATAGRAEAATPTYYANLATFQADITNTVTDDYSDPGYVFIQNDAVMSAVLGETDYMSTGFNNLNIVNGGYYCAGCNGSFQLSFQTTTVGNAVGVNGVGVYIQTHNMATPYYAYITFADGTTANIALPASGNFWGVAAPERIESIHFGLSMGVSTTGGYFEIDDLIVGDGNIGTCMVDADCIDDADPCTDPVCNAGMCGFAFNTDPCDDDEVCTENDVCSMGVCGGTTISCDDGNECTTDFCQLGSGCVLQLNTEPCDDGSVCTEDDVCSMGVCGGTMIDCDDGNVCSMDSCDPVMGCMSEPTVDCCAGDEDCMEEEVCDLEVNACIPAPSGSSGSGGAETGDTGNTSGVGSTGADGTGADGTAGDTGVGVTGDPTTGFGLTTSGGGTGTGGEGEVPPPDFSACSCTTTPPRQGRLWWLLAGLGLLLRRRRPRAS